MFVNENRLFEKLRLFFKADMADLMQELMQNSRRAHATEVGIIPDASGQRLIYKDNGEGTSDIKSILTLAGSNWEESIEKHEDPAGWGLFYALSMFRKVEIKSKFGKLFLDTERFFSSPEYRKELYEIITGTGENDKEAHRGFMLKMSEPYEKNTVSEIKRLASAEDEYCYIPSYLRDQNYGFIIKLHLNNKVEIIKPKDVFRDCYRVYNLDDAGNRAGIRPTSSSSILVYWHGQPIRNYHRYGIEGVIVDIKAGSPIDPVLPFRKSIHENDKYKKFMEKITQLYNKTVIEAVKDKKYFESLSHYEKQNLIAKALQINPNASPYAIIYPVSQEECLNSPEWKIISREKPEDIIIIDKTEAVEHFIIYKEKTYYPTTPAPDWVKITQVKEVKIETLDEFNNLCLGSYTAQPCSSIDLVTDNGNIPVEAVADTDSNIIYFTSVDAIWNYETEIFESTYFSDEGDTYDTQLYNFEQELKDLEKAITGTPSIKDILNLEVIRSFSDIGMDTGYDDITAINITPTQDGYDLEIKTRDGEEYTVATTK